MADNPPLYLASTSPYRRELLKRLGSPFKTLVPRVEENRLAGESGAAMVCRLARLKAESVADGLPAGLVIGADQAAARDDEILGKPGDHETATAQLRAAAGRTVTFYTGLCLVNASTGAIHEYTDVTTVRFRRLDAAEIERYLRAERPYDCAGSFKSEGLGIALFDAIETRDPTGLMGLPLIALAGLLRREGVRIP